MAGTKADIWSEKVGLVFDSRPRVATTRDMRWIDRAEEQALRAALVCPGVHVCLYGPSGSGKTSLAKTVLARLGGRSGRHIYIRVNHTMTWHQFKSQTIENKQARADTEPGAGVKLGIKNLLPYLEFSGSVGVGELKTAADRTDLVESLSLSAMARVLVDANLLLVVDDVNFASDELLCFLTDLSKEITDSSLGSNAKVIFVGADDICLRIVRAEGSLKDRMDEIALGAIGDGGPAALHVKRERVWRFISDGLAALGLTRPEEDKFVSKEELDSCKRAVERAADGLPKSIVKLGRFIANEGSPSRRRVSVPDISRAADRMTRHNFRYYRTSYRTMIERMRINPLMADVCKWMFEHGSSGIHHLDHLAEDLHEIATYSMFAEACASLSEFNFLVLTGSESDVFFAKDPLLTHTLGVALTRPEKCGIERGYFGTDADARQLMLRFTGPKDPENRASLS